MIKITWPNRLTIARIVLIGPFITALLNLQEPGWGETARRIAVGIYILMAISDGLDGLLARRLHQETVLGRFLDPVADKLLILFSVLLLTYEGTSVPGFRLPYWVAVIAIAKDLMVVIGFCLLFLITSRLHVEPQRLGKWCTATQLVMVIAILVAPDLPRMMAWLPRILWWFASLLAVGAMIEYFQLGRHLLAGYEPKLKEQ